MWTSRFSFCVAVLDCCLYSWTPHPTRSNPPWSTLSVAVLDCCLCFWTPDPTRTTRTQWYLFIFSLEIWSAFNYSLEIWSAINCSLELLGLHLLNLQPTWTIDWPLVIDFCVAVLDFCLYSWTPHPTRSSLIHHNHLSLLQCWTVAYTFELLTQQEPLWSNDDLFNFSLEFWSSINFLWKFGLGLIILWNFGACIY